MHTKQVLELSTDTFERTKYLWLTSMDIIFLHIVRKTL